MENEFFENEVLERVITPFHRVNAPMRDFIDFGIALLVVNLTQEECDALYNIANRFDNAIPNAPITDINDIIEELFELCEENRNIYYLIEPIIDKNIVYFDDNTSLAEILNNNGFNTRAFNMRMHINYYFAINNFFRANGVNNHVMENGDEKSIINKYFELCYRVTFGETMEALSRNLDINNLCLAYQQNPTEENKRNLVEIINDMMDEETKNSTLEMLNNFIIPINEDEVVNLKRAINILTNSNLGTYLSNRLEVALNIQQDNNNVNENNDRNLERIPTPFNSGKPMYDFMVITLLSSGVEIAQNEKAEIDEITERIDNGILNHNREEIEKGINQLAILCSKSNEVLETMLFTSDRNFVYSNTQQSLTNLLKTRGFNNRVFGERLNKIKAINRTFAGYNVFNNRMNNGKAKSIINKCLESIYTIQIEENFDNLSRNTDINDACLTYQIDKTEKSKQNLINTIIENMNNEEKETFFNFLNNFEVNVNNRRMNYEKLINFATDGNLGTCLLNAIRAELNIGDALNMNDNQIER